MRRGRWTLVAVCTATFALLFNITAPTVAFGRIEAELGASFQDLQWVISAYSLTLAALLLSAGDLADRHGRRRLFLVGAVVFILSSVVCGLAGRPLVLNLGRASQGLGGSIILATSLALLAAEFEGRARATAMSAYAAAIGAGVGMGPLLGGALTGALGWRWLFYANVPLMLVALGAAALRMRESRDPDAHAADPWGFVAFSGGAFLIVFSLVRGNSAGWSSPQIVIAFAAGVGMLAAFVAIERRQRRPMLDLELFRNPAFVGVSLAGFAVAASIFAVTVYLTLYLLNLRGGSPLVVGLQLLPYGVAQVAVAAIAPKLHGRLPARVLLGGGLALGGTGMVLMLGLGTDSAWLQLAPGMVLAGAGATVVNASGAIAAVQFVDVARSGMASGINNTCRQMGLAIGAAGLGAILQSRLADQLVGSGALPAGRVAELAPRLATGRPLESTGAAPAAQAAFEEAAALGFVSALTDVLVVAAAIAFAGAVAALALVRECDLAPATRSLDRMDVK